MLLNINQVGANWILVTWKRNRATDNISNYRVTYSYVGECTRTIGTRMVDGANSSYIISYNITGLGAYYNYNITLIAMNGTGRSPPHTVFSRTSSTGKQSVLLLRCSGVEGIVHPSSLALNMLYAHYYIFSIIADARYICSQPPQYISLLSLTCGSVPTF